MFKSVIAIVLAIALGLVAFATPLAAADSNMFRGKTITYIVSTGAGGIYDAQSRLLSRFLAEQLPGTRILVRNVPGAGHIIGANTLYASRPDGLTIGTFNTGLIYAQLLGGIQFFPRRGTLETRQSLQPGQASARRRPGQGRG